MHCFRLRTRRENISPAAKDLATFLGKSRLLQNILRLRQHVIESLQSTRAFFKLLVANSECLLLLYFRLDRHLRDRERARKDVVFL